MIKRTIQFAEIPEWTYAGKEPSTYTFFETVALADLEGPNGFRLTANVQKRLLGAYVFGHCLIVFNEGVLRLYRKTCFGMDFESRDISLPLLRAAIESRKSLSPGYYGMKYQRDIA